MHRSSMGRRAFVRSAGAAALGAAFSSACAVRDSASAFRSSPAVGRPLARVRVSPDRVIRTVVGLRPFRPSGFVVRAEKYDDKLVVHNYGHGGGGVTLSWGTAHLAVEQALESGHSQAAVIGCGAVGLATARLLQRHGWQVTIYARDLPPETTSNIAGAQWSPFSVVDSDSVTPSFSEQFARAARLAHRAFQDLTGDYYGVRWMENYALGDAPIQLPAFFHELRDLYPDVRELSASEHPFPRRYALRFVTMLVEPPVYLGAVLRDFLLAGGCLVTRDFPDLGAVLALPEPVLMNCTGLGAKMLFGDDELMPVKGQLTVLLPQAEVDYILMTEDGLYLIPRKDGILLGGTFERGVWSLEPNLEEARRIMEGHQRLFSRA